MKRVIMWFREDNANECFVYDRDDPEDVSTLLTDLQSWIEADGDIGFTLQSEIMEDEEYDEISDEDND
jgi:hypothetical protein